MRAPSACQRARGDHTDGLVHLRADNAVRRTNNTGGLPVGDVGSRKIPASDLPPRVVGLAEVVVVVAGGARDARFPGRARRHEGLGAVGVRDVEVEPQSWRGPPLGLVPPPVPRPGLVVELAGTELARNDVLSLTKQRCDVERGVQHCPAVAREPGIEHAIRCGSAVYAQVIVGEPGRVHARPCDGLGDAERRAQHRRGAKLATLALVVPHLPRGKSAREPTHGATELASRTHDAVVCHALGNRQRAAAFRAGNPLAPPISGAEEPGLEPGRRGPVGCGPTVRRRADCPVVPRARPERRAGIQCPWIGRRDIARVPDVAAALAQQLGLSGNEHAVASLHYATPFAGEPPLQARRAVVDAEGLHRRIGLQMSGRERALRTCDARPRANGDEREHGHAARTRRATSQESERVSHTALPK